MPAGPSYVVAVDAGGTHTRVGCFAVDGTPLATALGAGGSRDHNDDADGNVAAALAGCLTTAGLDPAGAVGLAAGMADVRPGPVEVSARIGPDGPTVTRAGLTGLRCPQVVVNDAQVAHRGALLGEPGVIVVAGTGSMIMAVDRQGRVTESGDLEHYAGGARHLVWDALHLVLTGRAEPADTPLVEAFLTALDAADVTALRHRVLAWHAEDRNDVKHRYGALAPLVTAAADTSPLADRAVRTLAGKTACGVLLLAPLIDSRPVPVALTGSLATDPHVVARLTAALTAGAVGGADGTGAPGGQVTVVPAALDPLRGAALLALEVAGVPTTPDVVARLGAAPPA